MPTGIKVIKMSTGYITSAPCGARTRAGSFVAPGPVADWLPSIKYFISSFAGFVSTIVLVFLAVVFAGVLPLSGGWTNFILRVFIIAALSVVLHMIAGLLAGIKSADCGTGFPKRFRPVLYFVSSMHARFSPTKHKFKYPLLYVGILVNMKGSIGDGWLLSVKRSTSETAGAVARRWSFFALDPANYFYPELPFDQKIKKMLTSHGLDPSDYPYMYLVTTPGFLGYSFNPVTYYYLYSAEEEFKLLVMEICNTFGEKHVYVLYPNGPEGRPVRKGYTYTGTLQKIFHISPYNHRSGEYIIHVRDPLQEPGNPIVDIHITVMAQNGSKSMSVRTFANSSSAFDILAGTWWQCCSIAARWGYNNFLVLPETFLEAWRLSRKNTKMHVRPEPLPGSTRRVATRDEREMQTLFLAYLKARVAAFTSGSLEVKVILPITYINEESPQHVTFSNGAPSTGAGTTELLHLRVLNPRFFLRLFSCPDPVAVLKSDYVETPVTHRPISLDVGTIERLMDLVTRKPSPTPYLPLVWRLVSAFRTGSFKADINCLDEFYIVQQRACVSACRLYVRKVVRAVITEMVAFGDASNLVLYSTVAKAVGVAVATVIGVVTAGVCAFGP